MSTILILIFLNFNICLIFCDVITEFRCTNKNTSEIQVLSLKCPPNLFINVKEALYGRNQWNECKFFVGDCTQLLNIDTQCCGRNDCKLSVRRIYSTKCRAYVSFFRVIYECQTGEQSTCSIKGNDDLLGPDIATTRETSNVLPPTSPDAVIHTPGSEGVPKDVYIIIGSAATVAFLLAAIVTVIFLLRKYQWHGEKQCLIELFLGMFKRHPPDGCESPTSTRTGSETSVADAEHITTISSLVKSNITQESVTKATHIPKSNHHVKNTSLRDIIKEVTQGKKRMIKKETLSIVPTDSDKHNGHASDDVIYSEIISEIPKKVNNNEKVSNSRNTSKRQTLSQNNKKEKGIFTDV